MMSMSASGCVLCSDEHECESLFAARALCTDVEARRGRHVNALHPRSDRNRTGNLTSTQIQLLRLQVSPPFPALYSLTTLPVTLAFSVLPAFPLFCIKCVWSPDVHVYTACVDYM